ncbi:MAG: cupin domain-containing protein [Chromatiales bacterium]|nr:cupin domain-containing protein [Chromatiales bacterium]
MTDEKLRPREASRNLVQRGSHGETICRPMAEDEFLSSEGVHILESWNVSEDPQLSIARARLGPGQASRPHRLRNTAERYVIVSGAGELQVGSLPTTPAHPGDVVYIPPGVRQSIVNTGPVDLVFYCICSPRFDAADYEALPGTSSDPGV